MDFPATEPFFGPLARRISVGVRVGEGETAVTVGGGAPIVVQSMTNTDTADVEATARQIAALARAGSELVRHYRRPRRGRRRRSAYPRPARGHGRPRRR